MSQYNDILKGGDLRSIGNANKVVTQVSTQRKFDTLFQGIYSNDRKIVMRTADAIEKITRVHVEYLNAHKDSIIQLCTTARHKELKWHLALLVSRIMLTEKEISIIWKLLTHWTTDQKESRIVRVNALQALFDLLHQQPELAQDLQWTTDSIEKENIPSLNARIRKLKKSQTDILGDGDVSKQKDL